MLNIKRKLTFTVVLILTLFLTVSINYASESNMEDSISLTDNTNDLEVSNDETTNVQADNNLKKIYLYSSKMFYYFINIFIIDYLSNFCFFSLFFLFSLI